MLAYPKDTAMWDLSHICDLCCSLWQHLIQPTQQGRDQIFILMDTMLGYQPTEPQWELCREIFVSLNLMLLDT